MFAAKWSYREGEWGGEGRLHGEEEHRRWDILVARNPHTWWLNWLGKTLVPGRFLAKYGHCPSVMLVDV